MFKTVIATLIIATASVALASKVNAGPTQKYPTQAEFNWMDRASQNFDARPAVRRTTGEAAAMRPLSPDFLALGA